MPSLVRYARAHRRLAGAVVASGLAAVVFVLAYFQPQDLFIDRSVSQARPRQGTVIRQGTFRSGEHRTTGIAQLLSMPHGPTVVRLARFRTSNGPAVHVWLSAARPGAADAAVAGSRHLDLGGLQGNVGDQNYSVPPSARRGSYRTVVIWCARFSVVFGYAPLE